MIGQATSISGKKYNIVILAGGAGSRMGTASDFIPKALSKFGNKRAIDYIIERYLHVANKFIIGTGYHADLLQSYVKGQYPNLPISFSYEDPKDLKNTAISTTYCLDLADSRYGTIISFCDLLMMSNVTVNDDTAYYVDKSTQGKVGIFRHSVEIQNNKLKDFIQYTTPIEIVGDSNGNLGIFNFSDTVLLKSIIYKNYNTANDLTWDIVREYNKVKQLNVEHCKCVYEFGLENDLKEVRDLWEKS